MSSETVNIVTRLLAAMAAGGMVGFERTYHGRPAGFRTHTLVCLASSLLMLVTIYQEKWFTSAMFETVKVDPTRMAQGIMTGIGFLGAGVIMKEGLSVRGLTTAASIWITAAIGILAGVGFYDAVFIVTILTLGTLSVFRWIESRMPTLIYAHHSLRFHRDKVMPERDLKTLISDHGFSIANLSHRLLEGGRFFEYEMTIRTQREENIQRLSQTLLGLDSIIEFQISPTGD
ncbi:MAG TPA: MgtC/SapB family protein [Thermodesulfovibrionales bacterium]|nr:MgtC/SapB family protein [Thermodesulfovibrionales bacterium]